MSRWIIEWRADCWMRVYAWLQLRRRGKWHRIATRTAYTLIRAEPRIAKFVFPLRDGGLHELRIDLMERFLINVQPRQSEESVPDNIHPEQLNQDSGNMGAESA